MGYATSYRRIRVYSYIFLSVHLISVVHIPHQSTVAASFFGRLEGAVPRGATPLPVRVFGNLNADVAHLQSRPGSSASISPLPHKHLAQGKEPHHDESLARHL